MQAGRLRHRGNIEQQVQKQDTTGAVTGKWVVWAENVPFAIEDMSTREQFAAQQVQSSVSVRIRMRWRPGITAKMRIAHVPDTSNPTAIDYYDIEGPPTRDVTLRRELQLTCTKRDAQGFRSGKQP